MYVYTHHYELSFMYDAYNGLAKNGQLAGLKDCVLGVCWIVRLSVC